ncbi:hypothetical protein SISNIDRAFT_467850 [Sistotremastrum niveocremeum HHB9708]|uniref:F-box domain-containing protein n=1 Tax=Sistotremastrum niveocremeum HHB9708 TaxID=1314777 RepID=A0A164S9C2_9AGAM|nr:hypothetical protein SISNIDRAFT_467850 [Sistotremastrum niveocremeum HHB9708]
MSQFIESSAPFPLPLVLDDEQQVDKTPDGPTLKLPLELFRNILEEVASTRDPKARNHILYNLLLTSRYLYLEARRLLYRDIIFVHNSSVAGLIVNALRAGAAKYVHSFRVEDFVAVSERYSRTATQFFDLPLYRMGWLRSLDLSGSEITSSVTPRIMTFLPDLIRADSLVSFHARLSMDSHILQFLERQRNIQFLTIHRLYTPVSTLRTPRLMPKLKRLTLHVLTQDNHFQDFVEDRPITVFRFDSFHLPHYWSTFAPRLHALDMSMYSPPSHLLDGFIQTFAMAAINLRLLACFEISYLSGAVPVTMPAVFRKLRNLPHLEILIVSFTADSIGEFDVMTIPEVIGAHPKLKSIFVTQRRSRERPDNTIAHELQYTSESGWISTRRDGTSRADLVELSLEKLGLAYGY